MSGWRSCSSACPAASWGFLIAVNVLVFILGCFIDFFEIAFIVVPLLAPVAAKLGIDLVWFGVMLGVNLQTSFLTPPFGFALFYMRSVAPVKDYIDKVTGGTIAGISTTQIYRGAVSFIILQVIMIAVIGRLPMASHCRTADRRSIRTRSRSRSPPSIRGGGRVTVACRHRRPSTEMKRAP